MSLCSSIRILCHALVLPFAGHQKNSSIQQEPGLGFILVIRYSDQLTGSTGNLLNLQCFVGHHMKDVRVVEPFLDPRGSVLGVSLSPSYDKLDPQDVNTVKLSDVFDIDELTEYSRSRNYAPLISWNDFLDSHPKGLILVHHTWETNDCGDYMIQATKEFVTENNFNILRQVCINFRNTGVLSPQKFLDTVYGDLQPNEVVVAFNRWGGIVNRVEDFRLSVSGTSCYRGNDIRLFHHSKLVSSDCKDYSMKYLNKTDNYMAVMVRVEYFAINYNFKELPAEARHDKLMECFKNISTKVESVKRERNITDTLLTMDIGKHGSFYFKSPDDVLKQAAHDFFEMMFGKSLTQDEWEQSFEEVARFKVSGYIAIMQKALAANSACLLLAGRGSFFQSSAETLYNELHPDSSCVLHAC